MSAAEGHTFGSGWISGIARLTRVPAKTSSTMTACIAGVLLA